MGRNLKGTQGESSMPAVIFVLFVFICVHPWLNVFFLRVRENVHV